MRVRYKLVIGLVDQAVISAASVAVLIVAAQGYGAHDLGLVATGVVTAQILLGIVRATVGEVLLVVGAEDECERREQDVASFSFSLATAVVIGLAGAPLLLAGADTARAVGAACVGVGGLLMQDHLRFTLLRRTRQLPLLLLDTATVTVQLGVLGALALGGASPITSVMVWGLIPGIVVVRRGVWGRGHRIWQGARRWYDASRQYASAYASEALAGAIATWVTIMAIAVFASLGDAAAYRAVTTVFGATTLLLSFLRFNVLSHITHAGGMTRGLATRYAGAMSATVVLSIGGMLGVVLLIPDAWGEAALGETWSLAEPLVVLTALRQVAVGLVTVPAILLRAVHVTWEATRARLGIDLANIVVAPVSVAAAGVEGLLWTGTVSALVLAGRLAALAWKRLEPGGAAMSLDGERTEGRL